MKHAKDIFLAVIVIILGCRSGNVVSQPRPGSEPPPTPDVQNNVRTAPAPVSTAEYDIVKMDDGHEMVRVPAGDFIRGSENGEKDERPVATINLDEFLIDRYEVSNEQYEKCVAEKKCKKRETIEGFMAPDQPAGGLSWSMADSYCRWAGERLPTEAEWEKAARGATDRIYPWGNEPPAEGRATFAAHTTVPVTSNPAGASPYGALNMAGNVAEWVEDWYGADYYASSPPKNPTGPKSGEMRVLRGGSYINNAGHMRAAYRLWEHPEYAYPTYGVRCAK